MADHRRANPRIPAERNREAGCFGRSSVSERSGQFQHRRIGRRRSRAPAARPGRRFASVALAAGLGVAAAVPSPANGQTEGDLRLEGTSLPHEGRLEIYYAGEWGAVCDDYFGQQEATVACNQMGYSGGGSSSRDAGDAETGAGTEIGAGLRYSDPARGLTAEGNVRGLLTHSDGAYREWGAAGAIRLDPGVSGRGVSMSIAPVWGEASSGVGRLWSAGPARHFVADDEYRAGGRLHAELGYGLRPPVGHGVLTSYAGLSLTGDRAGRTYRLGARWRAAPVFQLELEGRRDDLISLGEPVNAATLRAALRW